MGNVEQRRHPRVNVDFFADWGWGPECENYDRVTSLSVSGCFLATRRELNTGAEIFIKFSHDTTGTINLKGAIRYQQRVMEGAVPTGAGVEFLNVSGNNAQKLQSLMDDSS
jgi:hypothetical protein